MSGGFESPGDQAASVDDPWYNSGAFEGTEGYNTFEFDADAYNEGMEALGDINTHREAARAETFEELGLGEYSPEALGELEAEQLAAFNEGYAGNLVEAGEEFSGLNTGLANAPQGQFALEMEAQQAARAAELGETTIGGFVGGETLAGAERTFAGIGRGVNEVAGGAFAEGGSLASLGASPATLGLATVGVGAVGAGLLIKKTLFSDNERRD